MTEDQIHSRNDNRALERKYGTDPDLKRESDAQDEAEQTDIWRYIESGDLSALTKILPK